MRRPYYDGDRSFARLMHLAFAVGSVLVHFVIATLGTNSTLSVYTIYGYGLVFVGYLVLTVPSQTDDKQQQQRGPMMYFVVAFAYWWLWVISSHCFYSVGIQWPDSLTLVASWFLLSITFMSCYALRLGPLQVVDLNFLLLLALLLFPTTSWAVQYTGTVSTVLRLTVYWILLFFTDYLEAGGRYHLPRSKSAQFVFVKAGWILVVNGLMLLAVFMLLAFMFHAQRSIRTATIPIPTRSSFPPQQPPNHHPLETVVVKKSTVRERNHQPPKNGKPKVIHNDTRDNTDDLVIHHVRKPSSALNSHVSSKPIYELEL